MEILRSFRMMVVFALACTCARAADGAGETRAPGRSLFSDEQIEAMWTRAREQARPPDPETGQHDDLGGEIIDLEPLTVHGENALLLRRIRAHLEGDAEVQARRLSELAPALADRTRLDARANARFFSDPMNHGPRDRPELFPVTNQDLAVVGKSVGRVLGRVFNPGRRD